MSNLTLKCENPDGCPHAALFRSWFSSTPGHHIKNEPLFICALCADMPVHTYAYGCDNYDCDGTHTLKLDKAIEWRYTAAKHHKGAA